MTLVDGMPDPEAHRPVHLEPLGGLQRYLLSLRSFQRNVKLFLTITAFRGLVIAALQTIFNLYLYSLGYDARFIGIINAVNSLAVLVVSIPFGYVADRVGRRPLLLAGGVAYPITILGLGLATSTPALLLFNIAFGGVSAAYWVAGVPLLVGSTTEGERVRAFSINSFLLWGVGPLGAFLSGELVQVAARIGGISPSSSGALRAGMLFMALLALAGTIPYFFLREPRRIAPSPREVPGMRHLALLFAQLLVPDVILAFGVGAILTFIQLYFHLRFHLDPGPVGMILAGAGLVAGIGTLSVPLLARHWGNLHTTVRLQWIATPLMVVLALATQLVVAVPAYILVLTLRGMIDPVYTAFVQERVPELYRARLTGFYSVTYSVGFSLGPAVSGQLQKLGGFTPAFLMGAGVYLLGAMLLYLFFGRRAGVAAAESPAIDRAGG